MSGFPKARWLGATGSTHGAIVMAPLLPVRAAFCSSWDRFGRPIFDWSYFPYHWWLWKERGDTSARDLFYEALSLKRLAGVTHVVVDPPDGGIYDTDWIDELPDWTGDGTLRPLFIAMVNEIVRLGFVGVFYCYGGGQKDAANIYNGNLRRMCRVMKAQPTWSGRLLSGWAWETFGRNPECTAKQNSDAWQAMHEELGDGWLLFEHVGSFPPQRFTWSSYYGGDAGNRPTAPDGQPCKWKPATDGGPGGSWIEADDPSNGEEIDAHFVGGGKHVPLYFGQLEPDRADGPAPGWEPRMIEILDRALPAGTPIPAVTANGRFHRDDHEPEPYAIGPDWFAGGGRPAGRLVYVDWEPGIPYTLINGHCTPEAVVRHQQDADALGITSQGCLPVPVVDIPSGNRLSPVN